MNTIIISFWAVNDGLKSWGEKNKKKKVTNILKI